MTDDDLGEEMGSDGHAHRTAKSASRQRLWALHQKLIEMGDLPVWMVHAPPYKDYGDCYVARLCRTRPDHIDLPYAFQDEDLDRLREMKPPTCAIVADRPGFPTGVIEVWM